MTSVMNPPVAGGAFDAFLADAAPASRGQKLWTAADGPLPALYISHGAPPVFDDPLWIDQLFTWSQSMPKPRAILIVSAHWEEAPLSLSAIDAPLVYDFGGFAERYFSMTYATPDATALADRVAAMIPASANLHRHSSRGLDHGAWVPLKVMYPYGDVPVLQLSLPTDSPDALLDIGRRLKALRAEGVLVVGSGFMTHGLPFLSRENFFTNTVPTWSRDFDQWSAEALGRGDVDALANFRTRAPGMPYAHPTVEHFTPLFVTLGAASDPEAPVHTEITGFQFGLAKRSFAVS
ncbi:dioxygenase family protein [Rhodococcoides fascians]|jgi:4,5-DOPA dioxygenase extradiol|uniref:dioxygenase family protein n=1 Tax=Rhodococcoides fascians TaxID=1828 RepID=UPI00055A2459|nr:MULTISPECIES: class III extradiol ring-cleavage dioxygenase [Rhodococcus]OZF00531.1 dioxygenase [Rhodococcus sp. 15-1189-1-1a]OZF14411.1 dioxygenase [Rhodococcus sp. 14-2686-1-2]